jgi:hypothetical protein
MPSRAEVLRNVTIRGEKPLGLSWRLEALHAPLPLTRGLMRVFRTVVEIAMLAMVHAREDLLLRSAITFELVRDDHPWHVRQAFEGLCQLSGHDGRLLKSIAQGWVTRLLSVPSTE